MTAPPLLLDDSQRIVVADAVAETCRYRKWQLLALNVRTNHVHAVLESGATADRMLVDFKAYATRALTRRGLVPRDARVWSRGGGTNRIVAGRPLERVLQYVVEGQGENVSGAVRVQGET